MILVAGHYCHDIIRSNRGDDRALGGSAAYASAIFDAFGEPYEVVAKAGPDFLYAAQVTQQPRIVPGQRTSAFVDDYRSGDRRDSVEAVCEPLAPEDFHGSYEVGIACAITGETPLPVLLKLRKICRVLLADAQALLRHVTPSGAVELRPADPRAIDCFDYIKASQSESRYLQSAKLIVTDGSRGCTIGGRHVPAFPAVEVDPTGAGDCFLAGFALGLARGRSVEDAARLGAWCGARAVETVGVPRRDRAQLPFL